MNMKNKSILTKLGYWNSIPEAVKSMWQNTANSHRMLVCTHRPDAKQFRGDTQVRRCSTGGRYGKPADVVGLSMDALIAAGFIFVTYVSKDLRVAAKCEAIYSNDNH